MDHIVPYLTFDGTCEAAMNFYIECLDGEMEHIQTMDGAPMDIPEGAENRIMHASMKAGELQLMASDSMPGHPCTKGTNVSLSLNFHNEEDQTKIFDRLAQGGTVTMELQDTFWGARFGMLTDKFGINWMFNFDRPQS